ncbi:hypothetical protein C8R44DRAFT_746538 [Mycena epipterygia]|nr:hypothetical protein C8R44DRAFT_746538 [Mycena epipterygia]
MVERKEAEAAKLERLVAEKRAEAEHRKAVISEHIRVENDRTNETSEERAQHKSGIEWDAYGEPYQKGPIPERGSSIGTKGGKIPLQKPKTPKQVPARDTLPSYQSGDKKATKLGSTPQQQKMPIKQENQSGYYAEAGRGPQKYYTGGKGGDPNPSDGGSSDDTADLLDMDDDHTYNSEKKYSRNNDTDSAWEKDPGDTISGVTP